MDEESAEKFQIIAQNTGIDLTTEKERLVAEAAEAKAQADLEKQLADEEKAAAKEAAKAEAGAK